MILSLLFFLAKSDSTVITKFGSYSYQAFYSRSFTFGFKISYSYQYVIVISKNSNINISTENGSTSDLVLVEPKLLTVKSNNYQDFVYFSVYNVDKKCTTVDIISDRTTDDRYEITTMLYTSDLTCLLFNFHDKNTLYINSWLSDRMKISKYESCDMSYGGKTLSLPETIENFRSTIVEISMPSLWSINVKFVIENCPSTYGDVYALPGYKNHLVYPEIKFGYNKVNDNTKFKVPANTLVVFGYSYSAKAKVFSAMQVIDTSTDVRAILFEEPGSIETFANYIELFAYSLPDIGSFKPTYSITSGKDINYNDNYKRNRCIFVASKDYAYRIQNYPKARYYTPEGTEINMTNESFVRKDPILIISENAYTFKLTYDNYASSRFIIDEFNPVYKLYSIQQGYIKNLINGETVSPAPSSSSSGYTYTYTSTPYESSNNTTAITIGISFSVLTVFFIIVAYFILKSNKRARNSELTAQLFDETESGHVAPTYNTRPYSSPTSTSNNPPPNSYAPPPTSCAPPPSYAPPSAPTSSGPASNAVPLTAPGIPVDENGYAKSQDNPYAMSQDNKPPQYVSSSTYSGLNSANPYV